MPPIDDDDHVNEIGDEAALSCFVQALVALLDDWEGVVVKLPKSEELVIVYSNPTTKQIAIFPIDGAPLFNDHSMSGEPEKPTIGMLVWVHPERVQ